MKMLFKELYLFSPREKLARCIRFSDGINVITSSQEDGTNRGKSVVMRSLYHSLGAEALFEPKWDSKSKVYILKFEVDGVNYYIYRTADLYKIFDNDHKLLSMATRSQELSEILKDIVKFAVYLPNRKNDKLEITPPVYSYLPFFLDQDHYDGSKFSSFARLGQYDKFKDKVLFCHFGAYDDEYFELVRKKENLQERISKLTTRHELLQEMVCDIDKKLEVGAFAGDLEALNKDIDGYRKEYSALAVGLNKCRNKLIELRNALFELELSLSEIDRLAATNDKEMKILDQHKCPECGSVVTNTVALRSKRLNLSDDIVAVKTDLQITMHGLEAEISKEEQRYQDLLAQLSDYEEKLKINTQQVSDVLRHKGLCEIREGIVSERHEITDKISDNNTSLEEVTKKIGAYSAKKKKIGERYYALLMDARTKFGLYEIEPEKFKGLDKNFSASGSDKNIATVIWFLAIIKLRCEFNPDAISFPIVFDSPNNVETDNEKKHSLIQYLLDHADLSSQMILSSIGFDSAEFKTEQDINLIRLENKKYGLLIEEDYLQYASLLKEFCDAE